MNKSNQQLHKDIKPIEIISVIITAAIPVVYWLVGSINTNYDVSGFRQQYSLLMIVSFGFGLIGLLLSGIALFKTVGKRRLLYVACVSINMGVAGLQLISVLLLNSL